jgi:hypothetical protein
MKSKENTNAILYIGCFLAILLLNSCNKEFNRSIKIKYVGKDATAQYNITCGAFESEYSHMIRDTVIYDKSIFDRVSMYVNDLEVYDTTREPLLDMDIKIKMFINYSKNKSDTVCLGGYFDTVKNSIVMVDDTLLLNTVSKIIYD